MGAHRCRLVYFLCLGAFLCNAAFWFEARHMKAAWSNVPSPPARSGASALTLGDAQMAYRVNGLMLQNLGNTGGDSEPLKNYDYSRLGEWFQLEDQLDPVSNFVPLLAAYYFGATQNLAQLDPVIDYLAKVGQRSHKGKWRWLAQAIFLARFSQGNFDKALNLSYALSDMYKPGMPVWTRQMPAFVLSARGDKRAAYEIMRRTLADEGGKMRSDEINFMMGYICERFQDVDAATPPPLCTTKK